MTHRAYTITLWCSGLLCLLTAAATLWATAAAGVPGAVFAGGPLTILAGMAVIAYLSRRELRATHIRDLAEANAREDRIART